MIIQNLKPNTDEWLRHRKLHHNASEAPMMMGESKNVTRNELLHQKATGLDREFSDWFQRNVLDNGHEVEAKARPIAEGIVGEELYPISATDDEGRMAASFDGQTMLEDTNWECKQWNKEKAVDVQAGKVPDCDYWQVQHQLAVNPGSKTLYMVTDGTEEKCVWLWVEANEADIKRLKAGWVQFEKDLAEYVPTEKKAEAVGDKPDSLPALHIAVEGAVTTSNLPAFKEQALAMIASVKTDLKTDKDFADAAELVKAFKAGEDELESAKKRALSQTASIEELFRTVDDVKEKMRSKRLELNRRVTDEKEQRKTELLINAKEQLQSFICDIDVKQCLPGYDADFAGAIKGKKKIDAMQSALDDRLAQAKIDIGAIADQVRDNLKQLDEHAGDYRFLFNDFASICQKPTDDFAAVVKARIADHKEAEQKRLDAERERIRQEEEAKARREAEHKAEQEALKAKQEAQAQAQAEQAKTEAVKQPEQASGQGRESQEEVEVPRSMEELMQAPEKRPAMPTPGEMVQVIADHYGVSFDQAMSWLGSVEFRRAA